MKRRGFDYRSALRRLDPARYRRLYPTPTREIDIRNRLDRIADQISELAWRRRPGGPTADKVADLIDEQRRLEDALRQRTSSHPATEKRREAGGKPA